MAGQIIKVGGNSQKLVFTMLVAVLLLEFGSLTKLQKIWGLAFSASGTDTGTQSTPSNSNGAVQLVQVQPTTHPTSNPPTVTL